MSWCSVKRKAQGQLQLFLLFPLPATCPAHLTIQLAQITCISYTPKPESNTLYNIGFLSSLDDLYLSLKPFVWLNTSINV
jgi:hypothetical protein